MLAELRRLLLVPLVRAPVPVARVRARVPVARVRALLGQVQVPLVRTRVPLARARARLGRRLAPAGRAPDLAERARVPQVTAALREQVQAPLARAALVVAAAHDASAALMACAPESIVLGIFRRHADEVRTRNVEPKSSTSRHALIAFV